MVAAATLAACGGATFNEGRYRDHDVSFRTGVLAPSWQRVRTGQGSVAFHHAAGGVIQAAASCSARDDLPLDVLANHLLIGFEDRREAPRERFVLDGRTALRTSLTATLDGAPCALELVILKKDRCVYDLELVASRRVFADRRADFDRFVAGFARTPEQP